MVALSETSARRLGLAALALALGGTVGGCTVAGPRPGTGTGDLAAPRMDAEPGVRVGVQVEVDSLRVSTTGQGALVDAGGRVLVVGDGVWTVRSAGDGLEVSGAGQPLRVRGSLVVRPEDGGRVRIGERSYRGSMLIRPAATGVTAVNLVDLETYLLGVVPLEIGGGRPAEELEAVKAQAIAARTYAIRHMGRRESLGFDFYATVMDQVYGGAGAEDPTASRAVRETRGEIVVYDGEPIEAYYHSTCGGRTAAIDEVWGGEPRPYLRSVSDRKPGGGWYCESSNRFRWTATWDEAELEAALTRGYRDRGLADGEVTRVEAVEVTGRTTSGRAAALRLRTNLGEHVVRADSIRWILRPEPNRILNSSAITVDAETRGGAVVGLEVEGAGWGHGIGMCQIGALGRSRAGHSYRDILLTYYPGTTIARLYR